MRLPFSRFSEALELYRAAKADCASDQKLPAVGQFLDLQAENLVLMAFKQSEDNPCE